MCVHIVGTCSASGILIVIVLAILVAMVIILKCKRGHTPSEHDIGMITINSKNCTNVQSTIND